MASTNHSAPSSSHIGISTATFATHSYPDQKKETHSPFTPFEERIQRLSRQFIGREFDFTSSSILEEILEFPEDSNCIEIHPNQHWSEFIIADT